MNKDENFSLLENVAGILIRCFFSDLRAAAYMVCFLSGRGRLGL